MTGTHLPPGARYVRTTPTFTEESVPAGLLADHRVAGGNWAVLRVHRGTLGFEFADEHETHRLTAGGTQLIPPERPHRVYLAGAVEFALDFYRDTRPDG